MLFPPRRSQGLLPKGMPLALEDPFQRPKGLLRGGLARERKLRCFYPEVWTFSIGVRSFF